MRFLGLRTNLGVLACLVLPVIARAQCDPLADPSKLVLASEVQCGNYIDENGRHALFCQWVFEYRAPAAKDAFAKAQTALIDCFEESRAAEGQVNHPDSYDQVVLLGRSTRVSLALKDKAAHSATYLFLRIEDMP